MIIQLLAFCKWSILLSLKVSYKLVFLSFCHLRLSRCKNYFIQPIEYSAVPFFLKICALISSGISLYFCYYCCFANFLISDLSVLSFWNSFPACWLTWADSWCPYSFSYISYSRICVVSFFLQVFILHMSFRHPLSTFISTIKGLIFMRSQFFSWYIAFIFWMCCLLFWSVFLFVDLWLAKLSSDA